MKMMARVQAVLKRSKHSHAHQNQNDVLVLGDLKINSMSKQAYMKSVELNLTPKEFIQENNPLIKYEVMPFMEI